MRGFRKLAGREVVLVADEVKARGIVEAVGGGVVLLVDAVALEPAGEVKVDGQLLVPLRRIAYVQVLS